MAHRLEEDSNIETDHEIDQKAIEEVDQWLQEINPDGLKEIQDLKLEKIDAIVEFFEEESTKNKIFSFFLKIKVFLTIQIIHLFYLLRKSVIKINQRLSDFFINKVWQLKARYHAFSPIQRVYLFFSIVLVLIIPISVYYVFNHFLLRKDFGPVLNLEPYADRKIKIDPEQGYDHFLRSKRKSPNIFLIKKMILNLESSVPQKKPMIALELFIEAQNPTVLTEIKNREAYFRDIIISFTSGWNYEQLVGIEGKRQYLNELKNELQKKVTQGSITNVYFKSIILKPE